LNASDVGGASADAGNSDETGGCNCTVGTRSGSSGTLATLLVAALAVLRRRRALGRRTTSRAGHQRIRTL
jgi:MYXO-CTERM domain-containing protein